jgi:hypothetical protein
MYVRPGTAHSGNAQARIGSIVVIETPDPQDAHTVWVRSSEARGSGLHKMGELEGPVDLFLVNGEELGHDHAPSWLAGALVEWCTDVPTA